MSWYHAYESRSAIVGEAAAEAEFFPHEIRPPRFTIPPEPKAYRGWVFALAECLFEKRPYSEIPQPPAPEHPFAAMRRIVREIKSETAAREAA